MSLQVSATGGKLAPTPAEGLLKAGRLDEALEALTVQVRGSPADAAQRVLLFQLLAASGQWERADAQLEAAGKLDASNLVLVAGYQALLGMELERQEVFSGGPLPTAIGEPEPWLALLLQALRHTTAGEHAQASSLRGQAFEQAPAVGGSIDGERFAWLADADPRFGPCLEVVVNGGYGWAPFAMIRALRFDPPGALCDTLWAPVSITWSNGGEVPGFVPVRYPGSERSGNGALQLARATEWSQVDQDTFLGLGQRMFATDAGEHPLLETREIVFDGG
ncbi:MAG: type VI secretion system accessory protein TagJ [Luteimonas sp.]